MATKLTDNYSIQALSSDSSSSEQHDMVFVIKHATLMSQGIWNNVYYPKDEIQKAYTSTDWNDKNNTNLWLDHKDLSASEWIGHVKNTMFEGDSLYGDLYVYDPTWIQKLKYGKPKFGISPKVEGGYDEEKKSMSNFMFKNFSLVVNPAVKKAYLNNMEVLEMAEITVDDLLKAEASKAKLETKTELSKDDQILVAAKEILKAKQDSLLKVDNEEHLSDLFELYASKNLSVASINSRARQIRENSESFVSAVKRAAKLEELDMEKIAEEAKIEADVKLKAETETVDALKTKLEMFEKKVKELSEKLNEPEKTVLLKQETIKTSGDINKQFLSFLQDFVKEGA